MTSWFKILSILQLTTILGGVFALLSLDVVTPVHAAWGWSDVPTQKQQINMHVPGMNNWNPGYWKQVVDNDSSTGVAYITK